MSFENNVKISFSLNGQTVQTEVPSTMTLLELLRREYSLFSAKEGCGKGECGACSVMLNGSVITSCLKLAATMKAEDTVETIEGLASDPTMKNLQESFVDYGAVQCGFCIPGMVLSAYKLVRDNPAPNHSNVKQALSGNICRCTGYSKIEDAVLKAAERCRGKK